MLVVREACCFGLLNYENGGAVVGAKRKAGEIWVAQETYAKAPHLVGIAVIVVEGVPVNAG